MPKKISLCMIVGNVEEYIERCLTSFSPIADEICIVRAIGNQKHDDTVHIAATLCGKLGISFKWSEYKNAPEHADWPHIDDFAAARQMSFGMATGDYTFWCDSDDILTSGAERVRELAEKGGYPVFIFPYHIFGRGITVLRERMMVTGAGKWKFPLHECYQFPQHVNGVQDDSVLITHLPHTSKTGSNERNLRILQSLPESEMTAGLWYHLHGELAGAGKKTESIEAAKRAIAHPDIGRPEKYELFLNLARMSDKPSVRVAFLHQAYSVDPNRREALGLLACSAMDCNQNEEALAYARQMMSTKLPASESWNDRNAAYGWLGVEIYTQALRANGQKSEAEQIRLKALVNAGGPTISLIHATRGRAHKASLAKKLWYDLAEHPEQIEHCFIFDHDDEESFALRRCNHLEIHPGGGCVAAWNNGANACGGKVIIQMSDDWMPVPRWDSIILERLGDLEKPSVLAIDDGNRKDKLLCMAICTRAYWAQDFFFFHPAFKGVYSDNYFTDIAYERGQVIEAKDIVFEHCHPIFGKGEMDQTYLNQNAPAAYESGLKVYKDLITNPEKDFSSVPGYCNFWTFYVEMARRMNDGDTFVEVGVWLGRSIIFLAQELKRQGKPNCKLIAVDTFKGCDLDHEKTVREHGGSIRSAFEANVARCGVASMIEIIEGDSAENAKHLADGSIFGVFIDAAHDFESVKKDINAWLPKVREGGVIAGHDVHWWEVSKAVLELIKDPQLVGSVWAKVVEGDVRVIKQAEPDGEIVMDVK